nr:nsp11 protein [Middle East respiratory syndrome-related coronavirus]YP_009944291.1 nsp11 [Betacoronavirus England 1]YP_009944364.1 nsp11 [Pipistrellus bat coronavirus HKU5]
SKDSNFLNESGVLL